MPAGSARDKVYYAAVKRFWVERPSEAIALLGRKALLYWLPYAKPVTKHSADRPLTRVIQLGTFVPILLFACIGVILSRTSWRSLMCLYLVIASQWLTYSMFLVCARYRSHVDALLIVLAALGAVVGIRSLKGKFD